MEINMNYGIAAHNYGIAGSTQGATPPISDKQPTVFETVFNDITASTASLNDIATILYQFNGRAFGNPPMTESANKSSEVSPIPGTAYAINFAMDRLRAQIADIYELIKPLSKVA